MKACRILVLVVMSVFLFACQQQAPQTQTRDMRTIENVEPGAIPVQPAPALEEEAPVATVTTTTGSENAARAKEEALARRMDLPFAPAIAMDPVDGQKVSITTLTPTTDYKNKIYYFSSEANRREFLANPEPFVKGQLARY